MRPSLCDLDGLLRRSWLFRFVLEILNGQIRCPKEPCVGDAFGGERKPERSTLFIGLNEVHVLGPERWILGWISVCAYQCVILGIHPYPSTEEIFLSPFWGHVDRVHRPVARLLASNHLKFIVVRAEACLYSLFGP